MEFKQVVRRALEVRRQYAEVERHFSGAEWTTSQLMGASSWMWAT
jgi:hypothetical protein